MKTILFKIQQFPHLSETFILNQITMAIDFGYDVKILVKDVLDFEKSTHLELLKEYNIADKIIYDHYNIPNSKFLRLIKAGLILCRRSGWSQIITFIKLKSKFSLTWFYEWDFYRQFRNTDIIHVQYGTNVHPVDFLKKTGFLHGKLIVSFHGHDAFFPINGFIQNEGYYDHLFAGDNMIVANTPYLTNKIKELGCPKENLLTVPVPVDTEYFNYSGFANKNNNCLQLITVGRLDPIKGHSLAINFIKSLQGKGIDVNLIIVGEGAEIKRLKKQIAELSLEDRIAIAGRKSQKEVRELLRESDIYIFTGIPVSGGRRETQGLATLEAQACGLPVLAFDTGGVKYTIKESETGFLCPEYDLECLYNKLLIILDDNLRGEMGKRARNFVEENFSKKVIINKWRIIYKNASK